MTVTSPTPDRLPWLRSEDGGFVAHPLGEHRPDDRARVFWQPKAASSPEGAQEWHWTLAYGDASAMGSAFTKQAAADAATVAWGPLIASVAERSEHEVALQAMLGAIRADQPAVLDVTGASEKLLLAINWHIAKDMERERSGGPALPAAERQLAEAISAELFRRRSGAKSSK